MKFFYWNESYEIGVENIDAQHQQLVKLINSLGSALEMQKEMPKITSLVHELRDYIDFHFHDEEKLFYHSSMPESEQEEHKEIHKIFIHKIDTVFSEKDLSDAKAGQEVFDFLVTWLINHILGIDKSIPQYLSDAQNTEFKRDESAFIALGGNEITRTLIHALNESEKRFRLLSDNAPVLIWITDAQGKRIFANKAWALILGEDVDENADVWINNIHRKDRAGYKKHIASLRDKPSPADFEYRFKKENGEYCHLLERSVPRLEKNGTFMGLFATTVDITSLKKAEKSLRQANQVLEAEVEKRTKEMRQMMLTDILTGTKNRRFLMESLDANILRSERYGSDLSLIFIDIDHFKNVNDDYGHLVGDNILVRVTKIIKEQVRECDELCRYGGEEFVILLPESNVDHAELLAQRILNAIRNTDMPEMNKSITVSAGLGQWQKGEKSLDVLKKCDHALYKAKDTGRDRACLAE